MAEQLLQPVPGSGPSADFAGETRNLPDRIADELLTQILVGELPAGRQLPPERVLADELGVDRTSLRMALRQLSRMKLVRALRGSGITVLDYRKHAGLDFLAAVLDAPGVFLGGAFLLEVLDHYHRAMPSLTMLAFSRATPADIRALDTLFERQLQLLDAGASLDEVQELELDLQDAIVALCHDTTLQLIGNSTRGLRRMLGRKLMDLTDPREQVTAQRAMVRAVLRGGREALEQAERHRAFQLDHNRKLHAYLASLPPNPVRTRPWQKEAA
jgi:GntR family transcriptional repressor for pyruvate dehydrogenase complex